MFPALKNRMIYNWSTIYKSQLSKGEHFNNLKPVFSIWILDSIIFPDIDDYHYRFGIYDPVHKVYLSDHFQIDILQLKKFAKKENIKQEKDRWLYFLKYGEFQDIEKLPLILQTKEMRQAMNILKDFSENQKNYLLYQSRFEKHRLLKHHHY